MRNIQASKENLNDIRKYLIRFHLVSNDRLRDMFAIDYVYVCEIYIYLDLLFVKLGERTDVSIISNSLPFIIWLSLRLIT